MAVETLCGGSEGEGRGQIGEKQKREKRQVVLVTERKIIEIVTSRAAFIILLPSRISLLPLVSTERIKESAPSDDG